jgi:demethylmenaquinone methyltransferase/2-methoxy-6-polyprenyl-1,4-benzoquinol methylase
MNADTVSHPEKAARVRAMFDQIAPRYDLLNHLLSLNIDKRWRSLAVRELEDVLDRPGARALDLCCGTGDLSLALARVTRAPVTGLDFCRPMLTVAHAKTSETPRLALVQGDAMGVPFPDASFDAITIAFGLRNLASVEVGLGEILRLLRPGGRAAILEFSRPIVPVLREAFGFYFTRILPRIGGLVSGSPGAYTYLPASVEAFPDQRALKTLMERAGFANVRYRNLSAGIAALHTGERAKGGEASTL